MGPGTMDFLKASFTKLNGENYSLWKYKLELILKREKLWKYIIEAVPKEPSDDWNKCNDEATAIIGLSVEDSQLFLIKKAKSAREAWEILKSHHEKDTLGSSVRLMRKICGLRFSNEGDITKHIMEMKLLFEKLEALGEQFSEKWLVAMLLSSLPSSFDTLVTALEARKMDELTLRVVETSLIEEFQRQNSEGAKNTALKSTSRVKNQNQKEKTCHHCHKKGHIMKNCWKLKNGKYNQAHETKMCEANAENVCFGVGGNSTNWVLDSGATCHISTHIEDFILLDSSATEEVTVASGETIKSSGKGSCKIKLINRNGDEKLVDVNDVLFIPSFHGNLLSVDRILKNGNRVIFSESGCSIQTKSGSEIGYADNKNGLFCLRQNRCHKIMSAECNMQNCQHFWHRIFGHRSIDAVKEMQDGKTVSKFHITDCGVRKQCEICIQSKMVKSPFEDRRSKSSNVLDLIHTDVCGPMQTPTARGYRYFLTLIDDYSRYTVVYLLRDKSEVTEKLQIFLEMVKNKFTRYPKKIRSDNGGEYTGHHLRKYLDKRGVKHELTVPYNPQQNGVAERKNRYLVEMVRCLLNDAKLPNYLWGEALMTANYLQNRLVSRCIPKTPFEMWENRKPDVSNLKIFGSTAYTLIPKEKLKKLDSRSQKLTFVGYDDNTKGYRLIDLKTNKIILSRDVKFVEESDIPTAVNIEETEISTESLIHRRRPQLENCDIQKEPEENHANDEDDSYCSLEEICEETPMVDVPQNQTEPENLENQEINSEIRRSTRSTKGKLPSRYICKTTEMEEPGSYAEAVNYTQFNVWKSAMDEEIEMLKKNKTWDLVTVPPNTNIVGSKWTYKIKRDEKGNISKYKARLVARGFSQKYGHDYDQVFAPVVRQTTLRILLSVASANKLFVTHIDVKSAFLNGVLDDKIYMKQPPGYEEKGPQYVCKLNKSLYGLKQAANVWNKALHNVLTKDGFIQSSADNCLYTKCHVEEGNSPIYLLIYVDDILVAAKSKPQLNEVEQILKKNFEIKNLGAVHHYLGLEVKKDKNDNFCIRQKYYIDKLLKEYGLQDAKISKFPVDPGYGKSISEKLNSNSDYRKLIGSLLYIAVNSRPDIAASISILSRKTESPTKEDWNELKRVLRYLKGTSEHYLKLSNDDSRDNCLIGYADASWAEDKTDRKSNTGFVFQLNNGTVSWCCRKQSCVALSSTESEFISLSEACREAIWIRKLLTDMMVPQTNATTIFEDNQGCLRMMDEGKFSNRTKHIDTKLYFIKHHIDKRDIICEYCPTQEMLADMLTKPLNSIKIQRHRIKAGIQVV